MVERSLDHKIPILTHEGVPCSEVRPLYFYKAMGEEVVNARIISFGKCNLSCPYCKRDGAFRNTDGSIVGSEEFELAEILARIDNAIRDNQVIRLSGGDPVMFQEESIVIADYIRSKKGRLSIATNGSDPKFCGEMAKYVECAAIDLKDIPSRYGLRTNQTAGIGEELFYRSIRSQEILSNDGVLVDTRTPVFGSTTIDDLRLMSSNLLKIWNSNMFWTLRVYSPVDGCDWQSPKPDSVISMARQLKLESPQLKIGMRAKWEPSGFMIL